MSLFTESSRAHEPKTIVVHSDQATTVTVSEVYRHVRQHRRVAVLVERPAACARALFASGVFAHESTAEPAVIAALLEGAPVVVARGDEASAAALARYLDCPLVHGRRARTAPLRVTLLGAGTVGTGVYARLAAEPGAFDVVACAVRDPGRDGREVPRHLLCGDPLAALETPSDLVVEVLGGIEPARTAIGAALGSGRDVVTANKSLMAAHGPELRALAAAHDVSIACSAAVGGAVPVLETIDRLAAHGRIRSVRGLLSGTANFVLGALGRGDALGAAVADAQARGLAEADPTRDMNGLDTAEKLALVVSSAFGEPLALDAIAVTGIDAIDQHQVAAAAARDRVVGLVATCRRGPAGIEARVAPVELTATDALAGATNEENRVVIETEAGEACFLRGLGAGRWPTTASVFADITAVAERRDASRQGARR